MFKQYLFLLRRNDTGVRKKGQPRNPLQTFNDAPIAFEEIHRISENAHVVLVKFTRHLGAFLLYQEEIHQVSGGAPIGSGKIPPTSSDTSIEFEKKELKEDFFDLMEGPRTP